MSFHIIYKNLFEVKLLHHFFLNNGEQGWDAMEPEEKIRMEEQYDSREIFRVEPTVDCLTMLKAHHALFRATPSGFMVGIKSVADSILPGAFNPFSKLDEDLTFRFLIRIKDTNFLNYTALPLSGQDGSIYVFKNYQVTNQAVYPSICAIQPQYKPGKEYLPGDMLSNDPVNQTRLFTALVKTMNNTSNPSDWLNEEGNATTPLRYASEADRYPVATGIYNYKVNQANLVPKVTIKNGKGEFINPKLEILAGAHHIIQADLRGYPAGFYSLHAENADPAYLDDINLYLLKEDVMPFGMIEIRVKSNQPGFDLLDQGHLLTPAFELRFRNRMTYWRYFGKYFEVPFEVADPLPVTRFGLIEITKPPEPDDSKVIMLPNPSPAGIKPDALVKAGEKKYYSDIHIN
jgi:hypothetical protein